MIGEPPDFLDCGWRVLAFALGLIGILRVCKEDPLLGGLFGNLNSAICVDRAALDASSW